MKAKRALVWIRRDLRLKDHAPLSYASLLGEEVALVFVFDENILKSLDPSDRRLTFIHESLREIQSDLEKRGSSLIVKIGDPIQLIPKLAQDLGVGIVCAGKDYEPYAKKRDSLVEASLREKGIGFSLGKDQVIFEGLEVVSQSNTAFKVFTPYKNAWLKKLSPKDYEEREASPPKWIPGIEARKHSHSWEMKDIGFQRTSLWVPSGSKGALQLLQTFAPKMKDYQEARNFPAIAGTSGLSVHLRFGTVSIRECVRRALVQKNSGSDIWLSELIWRDFYHMILDQFPHVVGQAFKKDYESIRWPGKNSHFEAWCRGETGFPIIDAAMRHFNDTGWMHNRLRMIVASFLTKDLLVDWRRGEEYFAKHLLDFDLAANNGGWQWSASTGCDAQPYFRIFNPYSQSEKFDPEGVFLRSQLPELKTIKGKEIHQPLSLGLFGASYPAPIVNHSVQREKALALFKKD